MRRKRLYPVKFFEMELNPFNIPKGIIWEWQEPQKPLGFLWFEEDGIWSFGYTPYAIVKEYSSHSGKTREATVACASLESFCPREVWIVPETWCSGTFGRLLLQPWDSVYWVPKNRRKKPLLLQKYCRSIGKKFISECRLKGGEIYPIEGYITPRGTFWGWLDIEPPSHITEDGLWYPKITHIKVKIGQAYLWVNPYGQYFLE